MTLNVFKFLKSHFLRASSFPPQVSLQITYHYNVSLEITYLYNALCHTTGIMNIWDDAVESIWHSTLWLHISNFYLNNGSGDQNNMLHAEIIVSSIQADTHHAMCHLLDNVFVQFKSSWLPNAQPPLIKVYSLFSTLKSINLHAVYYDYTLLDADQVKTQFDIVTLVLCISLHSTRSQLFKA